MFRNFLLGNSLLTKELERKNNLLAKYYPCIYGQESPRI